MTDIFGRQRIARFDRSGIYGSYQQWPDLAEGGLSARVDVPGGPYDRVAVLGMGGSASAGDIISGWLSPREGVEVSVYKGHLPRRRMDGTLAIACSASGGTIETIGMMERALGLGATVVAVTGGGELLRKATAAGCPHIRVPKAKAPRYMLTYMLFATIGVVEAATGFSAGSEAMEALGAMRKEWSRVEVGVPAPANPAKALASRLRGRVPKVYGTHLTRGVGVRFCNALNENAKAHAFFEEAPEAMHNDVESWESPDPRFVPVILRSSEDDEVLDRRLGWFGSAIRRKGGSPIVVRGAGKGTLAQLLTMAYRLDMASYYLAIAYGVDPLLTKLLTSLRHRLGST